MLLKATYQLGDWNERLIKMIKVYIKHKVGLRILNDVYNWPVHITAKR